MADLVQATRTARGTNDEDAYTAALVDLLTFHKDSFADGEKYEPISYKNDPFLSNKNIARVNAKFQNAGRTGTAAKTIDETLKDTERGLKEKLPNISALFSTHPNWDVQGPARESKTLQDKYFSEYKAYNLPDVEARYRANMRTIKDLARRRDDVNSAFIRVIEKSSEHEIIVHMDAEASGTASGFMPKATTADIDAAIAGIRTAGSGGLYRKAVKLNLLSEGSNIPASIKSQVTPGTVAFTYDGSEQIYAYVDRITTESTNLTRPDGWWANDVSDLKSAYSHIIPHEVGHLVEHEIYGTGSGATSSTLSSDMAKFAAGDYEPTEVDESGAPKAPKGVDLSAIELDTDSSKILADKQGGKDLTGWTVGQQLGSNKGGITKDAASGETVYMKVPSDRIHAENEILASAFYQKAGLLTVDTKLGTKDGKDVIFSEWMPDVSDGTDYSDPAFLQKLQRGYAMDAFLANWDSIANSENIKKDKSGNPIWVDPGGALLFRAQGGSKGSAFGDDVKELDTLVDPRQNSSGRVYGQMSLQQKTDSAKIVQQISPEDIDVLVNGVITDPAMAKFLRETLKKRREYILKRFSLSLDPAADEEARKAAELSRTQGTKLKGKGTKSGKPEAVSGRGSEDDSENFAELFSLYANTGDAPEWFVELLRSKGFEKRKANIIWRESEGNAEKAILAVLDKAETDDSASAFENSSNFNPTIHGSGIAHRIARWNGVATNKPEVVDDFAPGTKLLYRGVSPRGRITTKQMYDSFINDDHTYYSTTTMWGDGLYASTLYDTAFRTYASGNKDDVWEMALKPDAKVFVYDTNYSSRSSGKISSNLLQPDQIDNNNIDLDVLQNSLMSLLRKKVQNEIMPELDINDPKVSAEASRLLQLLPASSYSGSNSNWAALFGYDAIEIVHGSNESYFVFFNRGALQIKKK